MASRPVEYKPTQSAPLTSVGGFCGRFLSEAGDCCFGLSLFVVAVTDLLFAGTEVGLATDFGAGFLYMQVGFFPVLKKAAPTKIFGLGFRLLKEIAMAFLGFAGLVLLPSEAADAADAGLAVTLLIEQNA